MNRGENYLNVWGIINGKLVKWGKIMWSGVETVKIGE